MMWCDIGHLQCKGYFNDTFLTNIGILKGEFLMIQSLLVPGESELYISKQLFNIYF